MKIEAKNIVYIKKQNGAAYTIFDRLNFTIKSGEMMLVYCSGGGKSLLLKLLLGLVDIDDGVIEYNGKSLKGMSHYALMELRKKIGYAPQISGLIPNLTVYENIALPLEYHTNISRTEVDERVMTYLDTAKLVEMADVRPGKLTSSKIKLLDIIRAIIMNPKIAFVDDPIQSMSDEDFRICDDIVNRLIRQGTSFIITSDPVIQTFSYADKREYNLTGGRLQLKFNEGKN